MPALQRFYGAADPLVWTRLPFKVLEQFAAALPRIQAAETLRAYYAAALASGTVKRDEASAAIRDLQAQARGAAAHGQRSRSTYRPTSRAEFEALMAQIGMRHA